MPRTGRIAPGGLVYHVMNRGNGRAPLFRKPADYDAFLRVMVQTCAVMPGVRVLGWCLMPNHWHLVLWPTEDGQLSRFMLRLTTTHVRRMHAHRPTPAGGHVYQGRFKSFPIEADDHLATVLRYAEANPGRARLVEHSRDWAWSSLRVRLGLAAGTHLPANDQAEVAQLLGESPVELPTRWERVVDDRMTADRLVVLRNCGMRGSPFGTEEWVRKTAKSLGLDFTLRPRGRPLKRKKED